MNILTRSDANGPWRTEPGLAQVLETEGASAAEVMVFSETPDRELGELVRALALLRRLAPAVRLVVGSLHVSCEWIAAAGAAGAAAIVLGPPPRPGAGATTPAAAFAPAPERPCPALHVVTRDGCTASACGRHADRLLLGRAQLVGRCFGGWQGCPEHGPQAETAWYATKPAARRSA